MHFRIPSIAAAFALGACALGPDHVIPEAPAQQAWRQAGEHWKPAQPGDALARGAWWSIFGDARLNELAERAARANQTVAAADARYRQAQAAARQARAGLFPTLDATFSAGRSRAPAASTTLHTNQLALDASWEPDLWGRLGRSIEAGEAQAQSTAADVESIRLSVVGALAQNYFSLRVADAQARLLQDTVAGYARSLQLTRNRYAAGVAAKTDVVQAETQLQGTQAQLADLTLQRAQLEHVIAVLSGEPPLAFSIAPVPALAAVPGIPLGLPSELLERRPDVAFAERRVAAANARIGVAQAAFFPSLSLSGTAGSRSASFASLLGSPTHFWSVGVAAAQALFDGGARQALEDQARAAYDGEVALYRGTVLAAFQEVEDNLAALRILEQEIGYQEGAVRSARESVEMMLNRYKAGAASFLDVIAVQTIALSAERTLVTLRGRRLAAAVLLVMALGGGWQAPPR